MLGYKLESIKDKILYIKHLQLGMSRYHWLVVEGDFKEYLLFFQHVLETNNEMTNYVDFYYSQLEKEEKQRIKNLLSTRENEMIMQYEDQSEIYYQLDETNMEFFLRISYEEWLFSSFYFTKYPCTIWSNYNHRFLLFFDDLTIMKWYVDIAKTCGLVIESE